MLYFIIFSILISFYFFIIFIFCIFLIILFQKYKEVIIKHNLLLKCGKTQQSAYSTDILLCIYITSLSDTATSLEIGISIKEDFVKGISPSAKDFNRISSNFFS